MHNIPNIILGIQVLNFFFKRQRFEIFEKIFLFQSNLLPACEAKTM